MYTGSPDSSKNTQRFSLISKDEACAGPCMMTEDVNTLDQEGTPLVQSRSMTSKSLKAYFPFAFEFTFIGEFEEGGR